MRQSTARKHVETVPAPVHAHKDANKSTVVTLPKFTPSADKPSKKKAPVTNQDYIEQMEEGRIEALYDKLGDFV